MSLFVVFPPPENAPPGTECLCGAEAELVYTASDGSKLAVCSEACLLELTVSVDGDMADGVMTPEEVEASIGRRTWEMAEEAGQRRLF